MNSQSEFDWVWYNYDNLEFTINMKILRCPYLLALNLHWNVNASYLYQCKYNNFQHKLLLRNF